MSHISTSAAACFWLGRCKVLRWGGSVRMGEWRGFGGGVGRLRVWVDYLVVDMMVGARKM